MSVQSDASLPAREPIPQLQSSSIPDPLDIYKRELANAKEFKALRILQSLEDRLHNRETAAAPTTTNSKQTVKPPPFVACTLCRQCKAKCVISDPASGQCDRCKACKCQCVFEGHKRGRKRQELTLDGSPSQPPPSHTLRITSMEIDSDEDEDGDLSSPNTQPSQSAAHPLQLIAGSSRPLSLKNLLNPSTSGGQERPTRGLSADKSKGDIVSRGVISLEMAQKLFHLSKSSFLFTTILSSAARFIAPSISTMLSRVVAEYSVQAIFGSRKSVETVQGWMMPPKDKRAWTYVGLVCRTATEIGLDNTPTEDQPGASELQQRERRNCARTWMLTFMMDRAMASTVGREQSRRFSEHPLREHGDAVIAGFTELRWISSEATDELSRGRHQKETKNGDITRKLLTVNYDLDEWRSFWQLETSRHSSPPIYMAFLTFFELHIRLTLNSFAVDLQHSFNGFSPGLFDPKIQQAERYCLDLARQSLSQLKTIYDIDASILHHAQDSVSIMVAYAACFLRALLNSSTFTETERSEAFSLIAQTSDLFKRFSENTETTAALQADFLQSLAHHADQVLPPDNNLNMNQGFHNLTQESQMDNDWLSSFMQVANFLSESTGLPNEDRSMNPPNALLPQELDGANLAELSEVDWEPVSCDCQMDGADFQIMAQWLQ